MSECSGRRRYGPFGAVRCPVAGGVQAGFGKSATAPAGTPRDLFGFKDGTSNIGSEEFAAHDRWVWAQPGDGPAAPH